jgi:hypothetical protein
MDERCHDAFVPAIKPATKSPFRSIIVEISLQNISDEMCTLHPRETVKGICPRS